MASFMRARPAGGVSFGGLGGGGLGGGGLGGSTGGNVAAPAAPVARSEAPAARAHGGGNGSLKQRLLELAASEKPELKKAASSANFSLLGKTKDDGGSFAKMVQQATESAKEDVTHTTDYKLQPPERLIAGNPDIRRMLADVKKEQLKLVRKHDLDKNGIIDSRELQCALADRPIAHDSAVAPRTFSHVQVSATSPLLALP